MASPRLGLWVGDSFAETYVAPFTASTGSTPTAASKTALASRWFLPKKSLSDGLRDALRELKESDLIGAAGELPAEGEIYIATSRTESALARRQGSTPALLVTSGFESWVRLRAPLSNPWPGLRPKREWLVVPPDHVYGIEERLAPDGKVEKELKLEELEFLVAKLELAKVKEIALGFLHARKNPAHEKTAAEFLRSKGFRVVESHALTDVASLDEATVWKRASEAAFVDGLLRDEEKAIREVMTAEGVSWKLRLWTSTGLTQALAENDISAARARGGVDCSLREAAGKTDDLILHLGLEEFTSVSSGSVSLLPVQPTCQIGASTWLFPTWTGEDRGYEPGPMLFGKSHQLTLLDVLFVRGRLKDSISAFTDRVSDKSSARILEAIFTLGKDLAAPGSRAADSKEIAGDLETAAVERMLFTIATSVAPSGRVVLIGALASVFAPLLQARRPDLKFVVSTEDTVLAKSALGISGGFA